MLGCRLLAGEVLGVDGAIARAWTNNLELVAARVVIREARARADQAGRLSNPELETGMYPNTRGREGFVTLSLVQRFPLTSRLKLEKAVSKFGIEAAEAEVADQERRLAGEVLEGAVGWLALDSQRQLKALQWTNSQELVRVASAAAGKGEGSAVDATRFRVESERLMLSMRQLESGLAAQEGQLRTLLGMYEAYPIRISGELGTLVPAPTDLLQARDGRFQAESMRVDALRDVEMARGRVAVATGTIGKEGNP